MTASATLAEMARCARVDFKDIGFRERAAGIFTRPVTEDFEGSIGLNRAVDRRTGVIEVNPMVGIRSQQVERLLADLRGDRYHAYRPASAGIHLGYLMPEARYCPWFFTRGPNTAETVKGMVDSVERYAVPFMEDTASLARLAEALRNYQFSSAEQAAYRLPIIHALEGRPSCAIRVCDAWLDDLGDRQDPAAQQYRSFADSLKRYLGSS